MRKIVGEWGDRQSAESVLTLDGEADRLALSGRLESRLRECFPDSIVTAAPYSTHEIKIAKRSKCPE
ncbi:hypothetical protein ACFOEY_07470 [Paracandidimonas soli]|uniref:hypothetical protein n=1 Tax=Paracandidimonas soli TaxID=1917182 RepID=UPI0036166288